MTCFWNFRRSSPASDRDLKQGSLFAFDLELAHARAQDRAVADGSISLPKTTMARTHGLRARVRFARSCAYWPAPMSPTYARWSRASLLTALKRWAWCLALALAPV